MTDRSSEEDPLAGAFEEAKAEIRAQDIMSSSFRAKKLRYWVLRTTIGGILVYYFWHEPWMRWVIWIYVLLALLSLSTILLTPWLIKRKMQKVGGTFERTEVHTPRNRKTGEES